MSIKKQIFQDIGDYLMQKLSNFPADLDLPDLKWFDKQMGQFTSGDQFYSLPLPCILMEYGQFNWQTISKNQQKGTGILRFYIYFENYADSFNGSVNESLALRYFEFTEQAQMTLQGFSLPYMAPLERVTDAEDTEQDMIITSMIDYNTTIYDTSTDEQRDHILTEPDIIVERVKRISRPDRDPFKDGFIIQ